MKKIFYLGYYDTPENKEENRNIVLAATNKMTYIISAIERAGYNVEIVSASQTRNSKKYDKKSIAVGEKSRLVLLRTIPWGNKIRRVFSVLYSKHQLIKYILKNVGKDDTLIVYHSVAYADMVRLLKKIKKFKLVLEVEEIYADVVNSENYRKKEDKLFKIADSYIFSTELLNEKVNKDDKPNTIIYGTYQVEKEQNSKWDDGKIHLVYAGVFALDKGVMTAINTTEFLDSRYHIHIIGFGNKNEVQKVEERVKEISHKCQCKISYDGLLYGDEYIRYIQGCHIGLSPQSKEATFNETSFPSKTLSYLSNGLRVVSIRIKSIENSSVSDLISFYDEDSSVAIAEAIKNIDIEETYDSREIIRNLDRNFVLEINKILGS